MLDSLDASRYCFDMNSSTDRPSETLAVPRQNKKPNIDALVELANLRDEPAAFARFALRWPVFARVRLEDDTPADSDAELTGQEYFDKYGYYRTTFGGYAFGEPMTRMPPSIPKRFFLMWQMREALRRIWVGDSDKLTEVLLPTEAEMMMDNSEWASAWNPQLKLDWQRGEFVYIPRNEFQEALYELWRRSSFVKRCVNSNCPAPYFIADKTTQRYCSESCAEVFQRAYKLRWWKEHGSEQRRKRSRGKRGKR